jgi:hypothetical protein
VQFDATGPRDPALIERVSRSYDSGWGADSQSIAVTQVN